MSIKFNQVIIHSLQQDMSTPILSQENLVLNDDIEIFITKKLSEIFNSIDSKKAKFQSQVGLFPEADIYGMLKICDKYKFKELSTMFAHRFFKYMESYTTIPDGDLIVSNVEVDGKKLLVIIKINYRKDVYQHAIGERIQIISNKSIYDSKIKEAAVINLDTLEVEIIDNSKEKYLEILLELKTDLSINQKLAIVNSTIEQVAEQHFDRPYEVIGQVKNSLLEAISNNHEVKVSKELEKAFSEYPGAKEDALNKIHEFGLHDETIEISHNVTKKYSMHKLKTNIGIDIKLPTQLMTNQNYFETVENQDGTINIVIKNISEIISK